MVYRLKLTARSSGSQFWRALFPTRYPAEETYMTSTTKSADVIVIGAGIIGAACAWRLAQAGLRVTILERNAPGSQASQAALGVLTFHADPEKPAHYQGLFLRSEQLYLDLIEELAEVNDERINFHQGGQLHIALNEQDLPELESTLKANSARSVNVERVSPEECHLLEPGISPHVLGGLFFPQDAWIDNTAITLGIIRAAEQAGAELEQANVEAVESHQGLATGVRWGAERRTADWFILAAGCWSGQIQNIPPIPVVPVRGQAMSVAGRAARRVIMSPNGYLVPKGETQTMVGATVEYVGFEDSNTLEGLRDVSSSGIEISPRIGAFDFLGAWAGLRPGTLDHLPLIGPFAELPNLIAATGHFRNGILLAPITAKMIKAVVTGEPMSMNLSPFLPDRTSS
jgi:glycine oxidase